jgi:hypothetical protein
MGDEDCVPALTGSCRCGQLRFTVTGPALLTAACHCAGCQRMTASAYSLSTLYPANALTVVAGEPVIGGLRAANCHWFCPSCYSWLWSHPDGMGDLVVVRSTLLDDTAGYRPFIETWTSRQLPWATTGAVHAYPEFPAPAGLPVLLAEFRGRAAEFDPAAARLRPA